MTKRVCVRNALFSLIIAGMTFSCREELVNAVSEQPAPIELIDFKGQTAVVPSGFPKELFDQTPEEFGDYYQSLSKNGKSNASEGSLLSFEELQLILKKCLSKYPVITSDNIISETDLNRIFQDFPKLKTVEEVDSTRSVIFDYYQDLCKRDVVLEVLGYKRGGKSLRTASPGTLSDQEQMHLLSIPAYGSAYLTAGIDANLYTQSIYGNLGIANMGNAFRHSVWNAFAIRQILMSAPASKTQAIDFTQDGTSKHEMINSDRQYTADAAMDLHNNMSARVWMEKKTSWGIGPFRNIPSYGEIIAEMQAKAAIAIHYNRLVDPVGAFNLILNAHGGNNATTWNNLYNNMYGPYEHLVRLE